MARLFVLFVIVAGALVFSGGQPFPFKETPVVSAESTPPFTTPGEHIFAVPTGVQRVRIEARGAPGGQGGAGTGCPTQGGPGGVGGLVEVNDVVIPVGVTQLYVVVGAAGSPATAGGLGGSNGGGNGGIADNFGTPLPRADGGGGGGAADVRTQPIANGAASIASRLVVAGGGAGGGGCGVPATFPTPGGAGGAGNAPTGVTGAQGGSQFANPGGFGGGGGTQVSGGTAGVGDNNFVASTPGVGPQGGNGGVNIGGPPGGTGGGGGGGLFGGGGGGAGGADNAGGGGGGGGGGSNRVPPGATVLTNGSAPAVAPAQVIITWLNAPTITKSFTAATVPLNGTTDLRIAITNPNPAGPFSTLTGVSFTDDLAPHGLVIVTGGVFGTPICAGTITATAGTSIVSMTNGTIPAGVTCEIIVQVRATVCGSHTNVTSPVLSNENTSGGFATALPLSVQCTVPGIVKGFVPNSIPVGQTSTLTITLNNPNTIAMTGVAFSDNLAPFGLVITSAAPTGAPLCAGTIAAAMGTSTISLTGGTLGAGLSCQIVVTVRGNTVGSHLNRTSTLTSNEFAPGGPAEAPITVTSMVPTMVKAFLPNSVQVGGNTTLAITITNPNAVAVTGLSFTDNFASLGLVIQSPTPSGSPLCAGIVTANQGSSVVSLSGGTLAAGANCQILVVVRANNVGSQLNTTTTLTSTEFGAAAAASATLTVTALPVVATPTATVTPTPTLVPPPAFIPQVFQNPAAAGIFSGTRNNTPTPVRPVAVAPQTVAPAPVMPLVITPPRTGDAGLVEALEDGAVEE